MLERLVLAKDSAVLVRRTETTLEFPTSAQVPRPAGARDLGAWGDARWAAAPCPAPESLPAGFSLVPLRSLLGAVPEALFTLCGKGLHLVHWEGNHVYCGRCGAPTEAHPSERARRCPACQSTVHPRISPAVIMAVVRDGKLLLAHNARFRGGFWSVLAGFVEVGETLEECVARETEEEAGIQVRNIRYFASQPWPFPDSLMIAFTAEWASGELRLEPTELTDAGWFAPGELPPVPPPGSVARKLIDWFVSTHERGTP